jgi:hypothetical protein
MVRKIRIKAGLIEAVAELNNTRTAQAIWEALPIKARVNLWGEEALLRMGRFVKKHKK